MDVFKFGGASINSVERIKSTADIVKRVPHSKVLVIVSAMGKTTNALEKIAETYFGGDRDEAILLFEKIKQDHLKVLEGLAVRDIKNAQKNLNALFTEIEWMLHDKPVRSFDYYYDQIVCVGELLSSTIFSLYLSETGLKNQWIDVRDVIRTDDNFRDAGIDWDFTDMKIKEIVLPFFEKHDIVISQGFIGATDENESTTLGREGSDYTAAIFSNLLHAKSVTIWKDVEAVMNADPRIFADAVNISELSYAEVIEMAYYGAQVIHPKTIKPLQNKNIPLYVKSFLDPTLKGTIINNTSQKNIPPVIILKQNQVLMSFKSRDFSFVEDKPVEQLHEIFTRIKVKSNLSQHTAISLLCCFDDHAEKIPKVAEEAALLFDVSVEKGLTLLTIRHYDEEVIKGLTKKKCIVLEQKTLETIQMVMR
ncbi:MAG: aspartate kinase [Ferruginibacter sp.]